MRLPPTGFDASNRLWPAAHCRQPAAAAAPGIWLSPPGSNRGETLQSQTAASRPARDCGMPASAPRPALGAAATGKRMIFTGPDAIRDYRTKLPEHTRYVGATTPALGATGDLEYLWRTAPWKTSIVPHKHSYPGQIGWGVTEFSYLNRGNLLSGMQIRTGEFRQAAEDEITHRYQNPWQPPPKILDLQGCNTRGRLAWNCTDYDNFYHKNSKWTALGKDTWPSKASSIPKLKSHADVRPPYWNAAWCILDSIQLGSLRKVIHLA